MEKKVLNSQAGLGFFPVDNKAKEEGEALTGMKYEYQLERAKSKKKVRQMSAVRGSLGMRDRKALIRVIS